MDVKRRLIEGLPDGVKHALSIPYDFVQTARADRRFAAKELTERTPAPDAPQHIVWVVVDALRGDFIDDEVTPFTRSLAGTTSAVTPGTWTFPAVTSMLTGQYPHRHGAMHDPDTLRKTEGFTLPPKLSAGVETLTEVLAGCGYETYGGFGHDTPFIALAGRFGTHALYHQMNSDAERVLADFRGWFERYRDARTFGYVHLADPHIPVTPPRKYRERHGVDDDIEGLSGWKYATVTDPSAEETRFRDHRRRLYRASVDYVDDQLRDLHATLPEDTLFVVTSDHGEAMWEHVALDVERFDGTGCVDHGGTPYEELARVPLFVDGADWQLDGPVSLVDLVDATLEVVGVPDALETDGRSLSAPTADGRVLLTEAVMKGYEKKAVMTDGWKLIDSEETSMGLSLPAEQPTSLPADVEERLRAALPTESATAGDGVAVSQLVQNRLEDLGYK